VPRAVPNTDASVQSNCSCFGAPTNPTRALNPTGQREQSEADPEKGECRFRSFSVTRVMLVSTPDVLFVRAGRRAERP